MIGLLRTGSQPAGDHPFEGTEEAEAAEGAVGPAVDQAVVEVAVPPRGAGCGGALKAGEPPPIE